MRAVRYTVAGTIAFVIDFGCLLLLFGHIDLIAANTIAFLIANTVNFWLGHVWVFDKSLRDPEITRRYFAVLGVSIVGLALNDAIVWGGVVIAELGVVVSKVLASVAALFWNFAARARWIYREDT